jgi:hypothetical protein
VWGKDARQFTLRALGYQIKIHLLPFAFAHLCHHRKAIHRAHSNFDL